MNSFNISDLKEGIYFSSDVMLDKNFILMNSMTRLTGPVIKALIDWNFKQIFSTGNITVQETADGKVTDTLSLAGTSNWSEEIKAETQTPVLTKDIQSIIESVAKEKENTSEMEAERLRLVEKVYAQYIDYIHAVYTRFATHKELDLKAISKNMQDMCVFIKENDRYILRIIQTVPSRDKNFIVMHSLRSTVIAIAIGLQLKLSLSKLTDLGISCMLHKIGLLRLSPRLYLTEKPLTISEKKALLSHPIVAYNILKNYNFSLSVCLGALEHHERENGSGYPQKEDGSKISLYAKIIAVACFYESMTSGRQYREAQNGNAAMVELLKNSGTQYDEAVIKALLYSLSLFPLGTYVYLSDGKIGVSVDVNPLDPKNPVIELINETDENGNPKTVQPGGRDLSITRALTESELNDLLKSMAKEKSA